MDIQYERIRQLNEQAWSDRNKDVQKSLKMAQDAQAMIKACPDASALDLAVSLRTQGYCLEHLSRYREALTTCLEAMELASRLGDLKIVASIDNGLGSIYWRLADYSSALDHYMHGLRLMEVAPDPELEVFLLQGLGALHYGIGDYEQALKYSRRSLDLNPADITARAIGLNNTAYILHEMRRDEEALPYALQALDVYGSEPYSVGRLELLHTLGAIYLQLGEVERSYFYFEEAILAAERHENILQKVNGLLGMCQVHEKKGELDLALRKLLPVLRITQEIGSLGSECEARELLARLYKRLGNYQAALEQHEAFHALHIQLFNERSEQRIHNTRLLLEVETIQKEANLYRTLAATDALTRLLSRREFFELGERILSQRRIEGKPVCLLMTDLDHFKAINDQNGHAVGDRVLSIVAGRLKNTLRQDDLAGRYGGDEFVVLIPDLDPPDCMRIAERCQSAIADAPVEVDASRFWISISIGLVVSNAGDTLSLEELIQQADRLLLQAKKDGRNRIVSSICS